MANIKDTEKLPLHPIQMRILARILTLQDGARFRELRLAAPGLTTKHITYHIKKLIGLGFLEKRPDRTSGYTYHLTEQGKKFVFDIDIFAQQNKKVEYAKRTVVLRAVKKEGNVYKWLFYKRLKHPFYGKVGFPAGKIHKGKSPVQTAIREFYEETGLVMRAWELVKIEHNIIYKNAHEPEFDIYYYAFNIYAFEGTLRSSSDEGEYFWATYEEFSKMNHFQGMLEGQESSTHWVHAPKYLENYLKKLKNDVWHNKPTATTTRQEVNLTYIELPEVVAEY